MPLRNYTKHVIHTGRFKPVTIVRMITTATWTSNHHYLFSSSSYHYFISREFYIMLSLPRRGKLSFKTAGKTSGKQYFTINLVHNRHSLSSSIANCMFHVHT